jgi:hypothetical protein
MKGMEPMINNIKPMMDQVNQMIGGLKGMTGEEEVTEDLMDSDPTKPNRKQFA